MELLKQKGQDIWSVSPKASILEALTLMSEKKIGAVLVMDGDKLAGIFSERDFARRVVADEECNKDTNVADLMTREVFTAEGKTSVRECMELYTEHRIRHLPIREGGKIIGVLSIGDIVKHVISNLETTVRDLENYISGGGYGG